MSFIEIPDPENSKAVDEFFEDEPTVDDWLAEKRQLPVALDVLAVRMYLGPFGYMANDDDTWDVGVEVFPEMRTEVRSHAKLGGYRHYRLDCALHAKGCEEPYLAWATMRRLDHLRRGIHDPVKQVLGATYEERFQSTRFANLFAPRGTTAKLDAWFATLSQCINEGLINPQLLSGILRVFDAPAVGHNIYDESVFGKLLIDNRGVEPMSLETWSEAQAERAAPDPDVVIAQFEYHEVVEPTPRQQIPAPAGKNFGGGASKGVYMSSNGSGGISQPGKRSREQSPQSPVRLGKDGPKEQTLSSSTWAGRVGVGQDTAHQLIASLPVLDDPPERPQSSMKMVNVPKPAVADESPEHPQAPMDTPSPPQPTVADEPLEHPQAPKNIATVQRVHHNQISPAPAPADPQADTTHLVQRPPVHAPSDRPRQVVAESSPQTSPTPSRSSSPRKSPGGTPRRGRQVASPLPLPTASKDDGHDVARQ